jgi:hypothetical protein
MDLILIRVLHPGLFPQNRPQPPGTTMYRGGPLESARIRWHVDQLRTEPSPEGA